MSNNLKFYLTAMFLPFLLSLAATPLIRFFAAKFNLLDKPLNEIKTHKHPTPALGGIAVAFAFFISLTIMRLITEFPTGTLRNLRGMFIGGSLILLMGIIDDLRKPHGLGFKTKFMFQIVAALILVYYD